MSANQRDQAFADFQEGLTHLQIAVSQALRNMDEQERLGYGLTWRRLGCLFAGHRYVGRYERYCSRCGRRPSS